MTQRNAPVAVEPVSDYTVYDCTSEGGETDLSVVHAHYQAGYLVVMHPDASASAQGLGLSGGSQLGVEFAAPGESSAPSAPECVSEAESEDPGHEQGPRGVPAPTSPDKNVVRTLCARLEDGRPATRQVLAVDHAAVSNEIVAWRQQLLAVQSAATISSSDVNPDPNAWTLLGGKSVSVATQGWFSPWYYNGSWKWWDTGRSEGTISLYRLNSKDAFDYFLVKMLWTVSPNAQRSDFGGIWFYNRDHKLSIELAAETASGEVKGDLVNFEPKTVATSQKYEIKFGGDLNAKVGEKPEVGGSASAEIATEFEIPSVSTNSTRAGSQVTWDLLHDYGPGWGRGLGKNWPNTTLSGTTAVTWALYRFERKINDVRPPGIRVKVKLSGNFGSSAEKFWLLKQELALPYQLDETVLQYPVPTMSYEPVYTPEQPLEIAPGATATVNIKAGAPGLHLDWSPYETPKSHGEEYLALSPSSGSLGDGPLEITALEHAEPGAFGYVRVNSLPWTATDSLRHGSLDLPVKIVDE